MADDYDVTVVMPAFQAERWIAATLASVRAQTLAPREIIVIDNGSTDGTADLAARAGATVLVRPGGGPSRARNAGIAAATTRWIAFCDADDLWEPRTLERHGEAARLCPDAVLTLCDWVTFDEYGPLRQTAMCNDPGYAIVQRAPLAPGIVRLEHASTVRGIYRSMFALMGSAAVVRSDALAAAGPFDEALRVAEDNDLCLRLLAVGGAAAVEEPLVRYRRHAAAISVDEVANLVSHRTLWARIAAAPERYPAGAAAFARRERVRCTRVAGEFAARRGRFATARACLAESLRARVTPRAALWYGVSLVCDNAALRPVHALAARAWAHRPWLHAARSNDDPIYPDPDRRAASPT